ncbi:MAG: hypothetical protein LBM38_05785 [Clostridiales bacterium]|jgi:uncharacterized membrane protein YqaE (UPF0057 family)|nr:hypothetical protein [Clostridiales bacterium]
MKTKKLSTFAWQFNLITYILSSLIALIFVLIFSPIIYYNDAANTNLNNDRLLTALVFSTLSLSVIIATNLSLYKVDKLLPPPRAKRAPTMLSTILVAYIVQLSVNSRTALLSQDFYTILLAILTWLPGFVYAYYKAKPLYNPTDVQDVATPESEENPEPAPPQINDSSIIVQTNSTHNISSTNSFNLKWAQQHILLSTLIAIFAMSAIFAFTAPESSFEPIFGSTNMQPTQNVVLTFDSDKWPDKITDNAELQTVKMLKAYLLTYVGEVNSNSFDDIIKLGNSYTFNYNSKEMFSFKQSDEFVIANKELWKEVEPQLTFNNKEILYLSGNKYYQEVMKKMLNSFNTYVDPDNTYNFDINGKDLSAYIILDNGFVSIINQSDKGAAMVVLKDDSVIGWHVSNKTMLREVAI